MNLSIIAHKNYDCWVFDHKHQNTVNEALCNGTENVIDWYYEMLNETKPIIGDKIKFYLDTDKFDGASTEIKLIKTDEFGSVYKDKLSSMELWLCPWLPGYFGEVPETIYIYCEQYREPPIDLEFEELLDIIVKE